MDGCLAYYGVTVMRRAYCEIQPRDGGEDAKSNEVLIGRWRVAGNAELEGRRKENTATGDSGAGDYPGAGKYDFDPDGKRGRADAVWARDRRNAAGGDPSGQSIEIRTKTFSSDTIRQRERKCAVE